jgi:hypothetical protein
MALFTSAFYTATTAYPQATAAFVLPALIAASAMLAFIGWRRRAIDRTARRLEEPAVWASLALAAVTIALKYLFEPQGLTPLVVVIGGLGGVPAPPSPPPRYRRCQAT